MQHNSQHQSQADAIKQHNNINVMRSRLLTGWYIVEDPNACSSNSQTSLVMLQTVIRTTTSQYTAPHRSEAADVTTKQPVDGPTDVSK